MLYYYVDGYNLYFRLFADEENFAEGREWVARVFSKQLVEARIQATIVFDAYSRQESANRSHINNIEIAFTSPNETADEYIIEQLSFSDHPRQCVIVTSDRDLAWRARQLGAATLTVERFLSLIQKRLRKKKQIVTPELKAPPRKKPVKAQPGKDLASSFDYFLDQFEKRWEKENGA